MVPAGNLLFLFISLMSTFRQLLFLLIDKQFINKHEKTLIFGNRKGSPKNLFRTALLSVYSVLEVRQLACAIRGRSAAKPPSDLCSADERLKRKST